MGYANRYEFALQWKLDLVDTSLAENLGLKDSLQKIWATIFYVFLAHYGYRQSLRICIICNFEICKRGEGEDGCKQTALILNSRFNRTLQGMDSKITKNVTSKP